MDGSTDASIREGANSDMALVNRVQELEREVEEQRRRSEQGEGSNKGKVEGERGEDEYTSRMFDVLHEEKRQVEEQLQVWGLALI
jgi:hypothetical protein